MEEGKNKRGRPPSAPSVRCPRCGKDGYLHSRDIGGKTYYYIVHYDRAVKKSYICYLGPQWYDYVTRIHDFTLVGYPLFLDSPLERLLYYTKALAMLFCCEHAYRDLDPDVRQKLRDVGETLIKLSEGGQCDIDIAECKLIKRDFI